MAEKSAREIVNEIHFICIQENGKWKVEVRLVPEKIK